MERRNNLIQLFLERNAKINLSSLRDPKQVYTKHILDSVELNNIFNLQSNKTLIDIWTWWWFPLLPLAITNPNVDFVGLDSVGKKLKAINDMISSLNLVNAKTVWSRSENHKMQYDYMTARAVWYADKLLTNTIHLVKKSGHFFLYKQFDSLEYQVILDFCKKNNLTLVSKHHYKLIEWDIDRVIYVIEKL